MGRRRSLRYIPMVCCWCVDGIILHSYFGTANIFILKQQIRNALIDYLWYFSCWHKRYVEQTERGLESKIHRVQPTLNDNMTVRSRVTRKDTLPRCGCMILI